jgi:Pyruvate/2-oxoacid:ferredoxin oxidoreductase gamma subunit
MERELLLTGIGGQGIQLASQVLARAAMAGGRHVQLFGSYGGMMRGGNTDTTLVVGDGPIEAPPTVTRAWAAIVMHAAYAAGVAERVRPGGVLFVNAGLVDDAGLVADPSVSTHLVPATDLAIEAGTPVNGTMVMLGAFAAATGIVRAEDLVDGAAASIPAYRSQHVDACVRALATGATAAPANVPGAWAEAAESA